MAALGSTVLTLLDMAKGWDPSGNVAPVVELLSISNEILTDELWKEGNLPVGHRVSVRTGLPTVGWRLLNGPALTSKSQKAQITEQAGMMEAWSEVDVKVVALNGNTAATRLSEARAFIESMNQEEASVLFYGNSGLNPEKFTGFSPRYSAISGATNAQNVLDGGGTGSDNMSIWLVTWGEETCFGIYPKGSQGGLQHNDFGQTTVQDATGIGTGRLRVYQEQFVWECGLALVDWRYVVRICNIDVSNLITESTPADLTKLMTKAIHRIPNPGMGKAAFYMNRTAFEYLDIQRQEKVQQGGQLKYEVVDGIATPMFRQIPIRRSDSLLNTEARVV